jgi:phage shock protein A
VSLLKRIFNIGSAEANKVLDDLENPINMTEQGIRNLKEDLNKSLQALAEVKAIAIRTRNDMEQNRSQSSDYESKAMMLLKKAQSGELDPAEADRLATLALSKKEQADNHVAELSKTLQVQDSQVAQMEQNVQRLRSQISKWESEAKTLKARHKVSEAQVKLNKQLASIDPNSTISMLEKMKDKVATQEALAESYGQMADLNVSEDEEIAKALGPSSNPASQSASLQALKAKLGLNQQNS